MNRAPLIILLGLLAAIGALMGQSGRVRATPLAVSMPVLYFVATR